MRRGPWETLSTRITPKMGPRPRATMAYSAPARRPEMTTWPSMAGVMNNVIRLPLIPRGRGVTHLAVGEVVGPHHDSLAVLPLDHDHLVGNLEAVLVHRVVPEGRAHLELEELRAHEIGVEALRALHRLRVDEACGVARPRMVV